MDLYIRQMRPEEAGEVKRVGKRSFSALEGIGLPKPKQAMVALLEGRIVGAIIYSFIEVGGKKNGYVDFAFVDRTCQNQGVGKRLYKESVDFLWSQGCATLTASVKDDNVGSWGLLEQNGFAKVGFAEAVRRMGITGMLAQYFRTPLCVAVGMDFYLAVRGEAHLPAKGASLNQIIWFLASNLALLAFAFLRPVDAPAAFVAALLTHLVGGIVAGYLGTLASRRSWRFRLNNGGALIPALIFWRGGVFLLSGNWFPVRYERTDTFRRDMGVCALCSWLFPLLLASGLCVAEPPGAYVEQLLDIAASLLLYRILAFYPFECFGGKRVYAWSKPLYYFLAAMSAVLIAAIWIA